MNFEYIEIVHGEEVYREIFTQEKKIENKLLNFLKRLVCTQYFMTKIQKD